MRFQQYLGTKTYGLFADKISAFSWKEKKIYKNYYLWHVTYVMTKQNQLMFDTVDTVHCLSLKMSFRKLDVFILSQKWESDNQHWWPCRKSCLCISAHLTKSVPSLYSHTVRSHLWKKTEINTSKITNFSSFIKLNLPNHL